VPARLWVSSCAWAADAAPHDSTDRDPGDRFVSLAIVAGARCHFGGFDHRWGRLAVINKLDLLNRSRLAQARAIIAKIATLDPWLTLLIGDLNEWNGTYPMLRILDALYLILPPRDSLLGVITRR
jgi:hypothetical protein